MPDPLVSPDVDLRDFVFMPLDVVRLRDSGLATKASGEAFRAAVILWCAAWHQVPAASLPDDDHELAKLAGYGRDLKGWRKIRTAALHGFIKCDDGLFYHKVIAEKAGEAWKAKQAQRARTAAATEVRLAKQAAARAIELGKASVRDEQRNEERNEPSDELCDEHQGRVKGQGQGQVRDNRSSLRSDLAETDDAFGKFKAIFPKDEAPDDVRRELARRLAEGVALDDILAGAKRYADECRSENRAKKHIAAPARWLEGGRWHDGSNGKSQAPEMVCGETYAAGILTDLSSPQGIAWTEDYRRRTGLLSTPWTASNAKTWFFPTEWPPSYQVSAS